MEQRIIFISQGFQLIGVLHLPEAENPPVVIGSHGLFSTKDSPKQIALAKRLNAAGIAYFRFDHRGCGESHGEFVKVTSFAARKADLSAAITAMAAHPKTGDAIGLFGSSMGGAACLGVAGDHNIKALVVLAAPVSFAMIRVTDASLADSRVAGMTAGQMEFDISESLSLLSNVLIFHGDADTVVPYENARQILQRVKEPKELFTLTGADHPLSDPAHQEKFIDLAVKWFVSKLIQKIPE
ncbi:MAG: alpha/beta fold hydrolase [Deltaproteobacteria bacterium]|nr:alpha/beta fold hydrolase [Deltaproteobacteria bacterium]